MNKILIKNNVCWHYEVIESAIVKYDKFLKIKKSKNDIIFLCIEKDYQISPPNLNYDSFISYITKKYSNVFILENDNQKFDYEIHCTITSNNFNKTFGGLRVENMIDVKNIAYISHDVDDDILSFSNTLFLSKMDDRIPDDRVISTDILPFMESKKISTIPIFIIQGSLDMAILNNTKNYSLLNQILNDKYDKDFIIKIIGRSSLSNTDILKYFSNFIPNNENLSKIRIMSNLNWEDYHKQFIDAYSIIPLVSKDQQNMYYSTKVTSSINYGKAYKLKFLVDEEFSNIYNINDISYIYNSNNIQDKFKLMLDDFYRI